MKTSTHETVSPGEANRHLREYRDRGLQKQTMPHIVYRPPYVVCPWPNCNYRIAGVDFQLELMGDQTLYQRLMEAWWKGVGLVGRCPGCGHQVLFTMQDKKQVEDPTELAGALLPDDWYTHAYLL
jgi:hypothetical protein